MLKVLIDLNKMKRIGTKVVIEKMVEKKECPWCHGYGEIMTRDKAIDSDGSEDIGNTPYPTICLGCKGEGMIEND